MLNILFSVIVGVILIITLALTPLGIIASVCELRNPSPKMTNGGPRFSEIENKIKTQTMFEEIVI